MDRGLSVLETGCQHSEDSGKTSNGTFQCNYHYHHHYGRALCCFVGCCLAGDPLAIGLFLCVVSLHVAVVFLVLIADVVFVMGPWVCC